MLFDNKKGYLHVIKNEMKTFYSKQIMNFHTN